MTDKFSSYAPGLEAPATGGQAVTPSDTVDLTQVSRAIWIGTAGDLTVIMAEGQTLTFPGLIAGWHPLRASRVKTTGTAASGIVAVW